MMDRDRATNSRTGTVVRFFFFVFFEAFKVRLVKTCISEWHNHGFSGCSTKIESDMNHRFATKRSQIYKF